MSAAPLRGHYQEHPVFTPPDNPQAAIWRYIDFTKLVSMLQNRALFFSSADRLRDEFEGSYPRFHVEARRQAWAGMGEEMLADMSAKFEALPRWTFVNCWNLSNIESAALWGLYVPPTGGVAIRSTFDRLRGAFGPTIPWNEDEGDPTPQIHIGKVHYVDYDSSVIPEGNVFWPFVHKRHSFRFEEELRAVYPGMPIRYDEDGTDRGLDFSLPATPGLSFSVDLELLIERIHVSPTASEWFAELVTDVCSRYGVQAPVTQSSLAGSPVY